VPADIIASRECRTAVMLRNIPNMLIHHGDQEAWLVHFTNVSSIAINTGSARWSGFKADIAGDLASDMSQVSAILFNVIASHCLQVSIKAHYYEPAQDPMKKLAQRHPSGLRNVRAGNNPSCRGRLLSEPRRSSSSFSFVFIYGFSACLALCLVIGVVANART
jgi:hypothetical protein